MSDELKNFIDIGAIGTALLSFFAWFFNILPHAITLISSLLALVVLIFRVLEELEKRGYIERKRRTRKDDSDNEL